MELTAAGLFRTFTGFPFHHVAQKSAVNHASAKVKKHVVECKSVFYPDKEYDLSL
jgi:hypothetical protein